MDWSFRLRLLALLAAALSWSSAHAATAPKTVCTVTINSDDEKETFRRHLPDSKYRFVELIKPGRPDWLRAACRSGVSCDVLIVSAHFDGDNDFYSEYLEAQEYLTVSELERLSCSNSCPALFSHLKEVYLFGCNTLNPQPIDSASDEVMQRLVREGRSNERAARRQLQSMSAAHSQSSRDLMRQIFKDVPVIYGFASKAPPGPEAGPLLANHLRTAGRREFASGRKSDRLLRTFAPFGMTAAPGMTDQDPHADSRAQMCRFADDRLAPATKLEFVHGLLQGQLGETRLHLDRIQRLMTELDHRARQAPAVSRALKKIADDKPARARFLDYARGPEPLAVRVSYVNLARDLGWLSSDGRREELTRVLADLQSRKSIGLSELNLACGLNREHDLDGTYERAEPKRPLDDLAHAAVRACLGSADDRARTLNGLVSTDDDDVRIAQAYLRHRPIADTGELRRVVSGIADMRATEAQVRALDTLARHYVSDPEVLERLVRLYAETPSASVQAAVAGVLIRADLSTVTAAALVKTLREERRPLPGNNGAVDALIKRLQSP